MALPPEEEKKADPKVFRGAEVLSNSEVAFVLNTYLTSRQEEMKALGRDYAAPPVIDKTYQYVKKYGPITNQEALMQIRRTLLFEHDPPVHQYEYGLIANLAPADAEEAQTLIPSLKDTRFTTDVLDALLADITRMRSF